MIKNKMSQKTLFLPFFCIFGILTVLGRPVFASDCVIEVAVGQWPPYISETQKHNGVITHVITETFSNMNVDVKVVFLPWPRAYKMAARGNFAATGVWMYKAEREGDFIFSEAILNEQFVFFYRKSIKFKWNTLEDLHGLSIGGGHGYSYGAAFDTAVNDGTLTMDRVNSIEHTFAKLLGGRIDVFPEEINVGYAKLREKFSLEDQELITHHPLPLLENQSYLLFPKALPNSVALMEQFNQQLKILKDNGTYERYMHDYSVGKYSLEYSAPNS